MSKPNDLRLEKGAGADRKRIHLREISDEAAAPLETVGQDLRAARLRRGDDLATIARILKIRKDHLEALEEDRLDVLPGRAYAIGFVRSYASHLGLDAADTVERFKRELEGRGEERVSVPLLETPQNERWLPQGWVVVALVLIAALVFGFWRLAESATAYFNPPALPSPTQAPLRPLIAKALPSVHRSAAPVSTAKPAVHLQKTAVASAPEAKPASAPASGPGEALAKKIQALPKGKAFGLRNTTARVVLTALKPVQVLVLGPPPKSMIFMDQTMQPGDTYRIPYLSGTTLTTKDPQALAVTVDGRLLGRAGTSGETLKAQSLDPKVLTNRFNHGPQH